MVDTYSHSYQEARRAFREAALRVGAQLEDHPVQANSGHDGSLTIDVALVGAADPIWSVVVSSGLHGVEGVFGSAIQRAYLRKLVVRDIVDSRGQFVFIHSLNPFGFAELRRVNEDNVDLNRNFLIPGESYHGASEGDAKLNNFLNPPVAPRHVDFSFARALWELGHVGLPALKQAIAEGQYAYPKGIFFGGHEAARSTQIVQVNIMRWIRGRHVVHLDFHSGLGKYAKYKLLIPAELGPQELRSYRELFGSQVELAGSGQGLAYRIRGDLGRYMAATAKHVDYRFLFAEFGTYSAIRVLWALRTENQAHYFTPEGSRARQRAKAKLLECFCPASLFWRTSVVRQGVEIIQTARRVAVLLASGNR
jgi:hypothetical protein